MSQKNTPQKANALERDARLGSGGWRRFVRAASRDRNLILIVFFVALAVRMVYLTEYRSVPYYDRPFSDSSHYQRRAVEIASGDLIGRQAYFLGSPLYPYFMAAVYKPFGVNFTLLRIIQFLIGSATCALVYLLARNIARGSPGKSFLAGLLAAGYGTLVFYDGTILMTTLELFLISASLLALVASQRLPGAEGEPGRELRPRRAAGTVLVSGVLLSLAGLGRPNLLAFAPFGLLWIFTRFGKNFALNRWRHGVLFALGCILAVSPITIRNYIVSRDLVFVSSSAGVNLFIGNNPDASGGLHLPDDSGLEISRLYQSSRTVAQAATGHVDMKPSEVSNYWASRAFSFITKNPGDAARLLLLKISLFWNHYEIPNLHDKYYVANTFAPFLHWLFVGFGLIAPLAFAGILLEFTRKPVPPTVRLYLGFLLVYMCSVIPFFVTARYRIPVVPLLIVFASAGLWNIYGLAKSRRFGWLIVAVVLAVGSGVWVNRTVARGNFWFSHAIVGMVHTDIALDKPHEAEQYLKTAIVELKKALELSPRSTPSHYYLGVAYQRIGYYSGAIRQFGATLGRTPSHRDAREAIEAAQTAYKENGDEIDVESIPLTPFEIGTRYRRENNFEAAESQFRRVLGEDPQHTKAREALGLIHAGRNEFDKAIAQYKKALRFAPDNTRLLNNIASAYYETEDFENARRYWERSLEINPADQSVIRALRALQPR